MDYSIQIESYKNFAIRQPEKNSILQPARIEVPAPVKGNVRDINADYKALIIDAEVSLR